MPHLFIEWLLSLLHLLPHDPCGPGAANLIGGLRCLKGHDLGSPEKLAVPHQAGEA
ncbi:hypothetical protein [Swingsia samuiensis]|uniref:hypothetical protein n=1 Tax=Swingsia samuiensis TaxID=1293412 RepID=UPI0015E8CFE3|nr:hypothetical protein [Swingsia samuiensis]